MQLSCPICRKAVEWEGNQFRPFCSERCKLIDLGKWATESYRVPAKPDEEEERPPDGSVEGDEEEASSGSSNGRQNGNPDPP